MNDKQRFGILVGCMMLVLMLLVVPQVVTVGSLRGGDYELVYRGYELIFFIDRGSRIDLARVLLQAAVVIVGTAGYCAFMGGKKRP